MATKRKNSAPIPRGKWVKVTKAKLNRNGSVSLMVPATSLRNPKRAKRNVAAGFVDDMGVFHPLRASYDYSPGRVGEKTKRKAKAKRKPAKVKRKATTKRKPTKRKR